jgi:hypothetical protein
MCLSLLLISFSQAVDEAERALAVVQARLLEALKAKAVQEAEAADAKHASAQERLRLEAEVGNAVCVHVHAFITICACVIILLRDASCCNISHASGSKWPWVF